MHRFSAVEKYVADGVIGDSGGFFIGYVGEYRFYSSNGFLATPANDVKDEARQYAGIPKADSVGSDSEAEFKCTHERIFEAILEFYLLYLLFFFHRAALCAPGKGAF